jgi:DNA-directed RNA polymerase specialized sigma24 family protein
VTDEEQLVDELARKAMKPAFGDVLPPHLGREVLRMVGERLRAEGFSSPEAAREVFSRTLTRAQTLLSAERSRLISYPSAWLHSIACKTLEEYLREEAAKDSSWIISLLDGSAVLEATTTGRDRRALALVRRAIESLPERYRAFLRLDIVQALPPEEIQERMAFASREDLLRFKKEAFAALEMAVRALVEKGDFE